jgi:hypothetical protein
MISLDHRFRQGDPPQVIWPRCFSYTPLGTLLPRRILLAEPDCERASARGHFFERYGYEVLSCCDVSSIKKCFQGMAHFANCRQFVNLIICDVHLLDDALAGFIQLGQTNADFPPLLLLAGPSDEVNGKYRDQIKHKGTLEGTVHAHDQVLMVRQWAPY